MKLYPYIFLITVLVFSSCSGDSEGTPSNTNDWLVDQDLVFDGGVGRDGIPSIDAPQFSSVNDINFMNSDDLILGIRVGDEVKGYPHPVLDWHEIVNDEISNSKYALTYCPLTGTGIGWDRVINGEETTFGVSGLLFDTNLMPYDRASSSTWSQQQLRCVNGANIGQRARLYSFVETTWATWKEAYPESQVLNTNTGINRSYGSYPYGDYRTNNAALLFPITTDDDRLPAKERVLGIRENDAFKIYPFNSNTVDSTVTVSSAGVNPYLINLDRDVHMGQDLLIVSSNELNILVGFKVGDTAEYTALTNEDFPYLFADQNGVKYDLFGYPDSTSASSLDLAEQFIGYWFSWGTFYPNVDIFES